MIKKNDMIMKSTKIFILAGLFAFCFTTTIFAQHHGMCGTKDQHQIKERLLRNRVEMKDFVKPRNAVTYVPIKLHLVAENDGSGRANPADVADMMCILNEEFADQEIQFYIKDKAFRNLNQNAIYFSPTTTGGQTQIRFNKVNNAINLFITGSAGATGTLAFYQGPAGSSFDYIVARRTSILGRNVVPHEVGHFFSLAHPFYGWEGNPWNVNDHGNPVGQYAPSDPSQIGPVGLIENEKVDKSNCMTAADGICDTPPDYLFAFTQQGCAPYGGGARDPNNELIDPSETNIMSYFDACDSYEFTADQKAAIQVDLFSSQRNYIRPNYTPDLTVLGDVTLSYPINDVAAGHLDVRLEWEAQNGAIGYIVELDRAANFGSSFLQRFLVYGDNFVDLPELDVNKAYYWRVRSFGEYYTCTSFSDDVRFITSEPVAVKEIEEVNGWAVNPNPLRSGNNFQIAMDAKSSFEADIMLYSLTGQLVQQISGHQFTNGRSDLEFPVYNLESGMYIIAIHTEDGVSNKKVIISK